MAPNISQPEPTETSPLLGKPDQDEQALGSGAGILPAGPELHDADEDGAEPDLERQPSNGENFKHQGLPEVKKRMKYIFPAIAIGASRPLKFKSCYKAEPFRSSFLLRTRRSSYQLMGS